MLNEQRTLAISHASTTDLTAYEYNPAGIENALILTELTGWDQYANIEIETAPALNRAGSYVIGEHLGQREVITRIAYTNKTDAKALLNAIQQLALTFTTFTLTRAYRDATGAEKRRETLTGKITNIDFERSANIHAWLQLTFTCPDPLKTVYLNGSTTPESTRTL